MKKIKITVKRKIFHEDLSKLYENELDNACTINVGDVFYTNGQDMPEGFCKSAWETIQPFSLRLLNGETNIFGNWMKNPNSLMLSCNDGFRPVSFYIEIIEDL